MATPDKPLGERRERILRAIVEAYVDGAEPVGSRTVADDSTLGVSSATIRNEMGILEREGYIVQPHTSAGRIPTDKAYRYYVDVLAPKTRVGSETVHEIERALAGTITALDDLLGRASELLAELTDYAALASAPSLTEGHLRWLDLVPLGNKRLFMVVVIDGARHEEWLLELPSETSEETIKRCGERVNRIVGGLKPSEAADRLVQLGEGEHPEIMRTIAKALRSVARKSGRLYTQGASHAIGWGPAPAVRRILELLEEGEVQSLMEGAGPHEGVAVRIGSELPISDLQSLSLIMAGYELGRAQAGSLGVLGPTRMDYPSVMATVAAVARSLSRALRRLEAE